MSEKELTNEELEKAQGGKRSALANQDLQQSAGGGSGLSVEVEGLDLPSSGGIKK